MSRLLHSSLSKNSAADDFGASTLRINGTLFGNTASKFWSHLLDELLHDFSTCDRIILSAPSTSNLNRSMLQPEAGLQTTLEGLSMLNLRDQWNEVMAEMEILGPPSPVRLRLLNGDDHQEEVAGNLSLESVDAEIFPFLIVWLLEWAKIAEKNWQDNLINGRFQAEDLNRKFIYKLNFTLHHDHVHEGLYQHTLNLQFHRSPQNSRERMG